MKKSTQNSIATMQTARRLFKVAPLALAVSLASMAIAPTAYATDLDVYNGAESLGGETSVMMLFDVANTMASTDQPKGVGLKADSEGFKIMTKLSAGVKPDTISGYTSELGDSDAAYDFDRYYYLGTDGKIYYRRIDKVKMSLYHILDIQRIPGVEAKSLEPGLAFGLSVTPNLDNDGSAGIKGEKDLKSTKGYILAPAQRLDYVYPGSKVHSTMPLNDAERDNLRKANLPIASSNYAGWTHKDRLHDAIRRINVDNNPLGKGGYNPLALAYMETAAYLIGTGTNPGYDKFSGMGISADDSVIKTGGSIKSYKAPKAQGQCGSGKGIFVLSSGPGFIPSRLDEFTTYSPIAEQVIGGQDRNMLYCGTSGAYGSPGWDKLLDFKNTFRGGDYAWLTTSPEKQWYCSSALTRVMRGHRYDDNVDYQYDRENSKLFGDAYKSNINLKDKKLNILTGAIGFGTNMDIYASSPKLTRYNHKGEAKQVVDCSRNTLWSANESFFGGNKSNTIPYESFCLFTEETYSFGEGGLYTGNNPAQVAEALNSFISKIPTGGGDIKPMSTGTMSVPFDSLNQLTPRTNAYVPVLDPKVGTEQLWPGNLKKYNIEQGTIVGNLGSGTQKVFTSRIGFFNKNTKDLWNTNTVADEAQPQVGGAYQQILDGVSTSPIKTVNRKTLIDFNGGLKEISVQSSGQPTGFDTLNWNSTDEVALDSKEKAKIDALTGDAKTNTIKARVQQMKQQLVNFLGYPADSTTVVADGKQLTKVVKEAGHPDKEEKIQQTQENRVLGGVLHSRPQLVTYDAVLNDDGSVKDREDFLLYGSFDGALHMVDDKTGKELFNFIPSQVLQRQGKAFSPTNNQKLGDPTKAPYLHGVDAEWAVYGDYKRTAPKTTGGDYGIKAESMFAFGGLRMGGSMYYGLNITNKTEPKLLYSVGSNYAIGVDKHDASSSFAATGYKNGRVDSNYRRMGLTWGKPTVAYVKQGGKKVMVNILSGGYDECYEDTHFQLGGSVTNNKIDGCNGKTSAQGNAVYIVKVAEEQEDSVTKATTLKTEGVSGIGDALWWASSDATDTPNSKYVADMKHSVVNQVLALDGNYDGLTDHLYYADLGGQVWRVDINNSKDTDDFKVERVIKVFDASEDAQTITEGGDSYTYSPRIYETPLVTFQRLGDAGKIRGVVTIGTGDRSNPLDTKFSNNHIYTFIDMDLARYRSELFCTDKKDTPADECSGFSFTPLTKDLKPSNLSTIRYRRDGSIEGSAEDVQAAIDNGVNGKADGTSGWKYKLDDNGFIDEINKDKDSGDPDKPAKGLKMYNRPDAITGQLFVSVFSPELSAKESDDECSLSIAGMTNRERLCLPYGYCFTENADGSSVAVNRSSILAGGGIVDNYIGYLGEKNDAGEPVNTIGVIDTYCEGDDCKRGSGSKIDPLTNLTLNSTNVEHGFNPLKWFDR